ncbi:MAG: DUF1080 domain-containing protein, partial [bacterium]|nr:DUF1080 domain-containing protein [bacterium]
HRAWPVLPGGKWRAKSVKRPKPALVTPAPEFGKPPSDAIVLFDGTNLDQWLTRGKRKERGKIFEARWKVENGYMEVIPLSGDLMTKEKFGSVQIHLEWATPTEITASGQHRGNSGVSFLGNGMYEVQVLDSYQNDTYADGQAASMYAQYPPLVNVSRKPGEWQTYDIVFEKPVFDGDKVVEPAYATVFHNGVLVHHRRAYMGAVRRNRPIEYPVHALEGPIVLQEHRRPVRYRNVWLRRLD